MTLDLGVRKRRRLTAGQKVVIGLALLTTAALPVWTFGGSYLKRRDAALNLASEWRIDGPPCKALTKAEFEAQGLRTRKATLYEDVTFHRQFGHMSCSALRYGSGWGQAVYPVCQFTSPRAVRVTTAKGDWYFALAPGQPATVAAPHGLARCVQAANFTIKSLVARQ